MNYTLTQEEQDKILKAVDDATKHHECEVLIISKNYGSVIDIKVMPRERIRERKERPTQERGRDGLDK